MIQHIFFDLDNTLWDFNKNSECALKNMYKEFGVEALYGVDFKLFHENYYEINENLWAEFRDYKITKSVLRDRRFKQAFLSIGVEEMELAEKFEEIYFQEIVKFNYLIEGTEELLLHLQKKYQIHILSNGFLEVTKRKIETSDLKNYINTWTSAEEINVRKPKPEIFEYALKKANAIKIESIYIGDDLIADIKGGNDFGIKTIFYNPNEITVKEDIKSVNKLLEIKNVL